MHLLTRRSLVALALAGVAAPAQADAKDLPRWAPSIQKGLAEAKERGTAFVICLNMDNEPGNVDMVENVYTSKTFKDAAEKCVVAIASLSTHPDEVADGGKRVCTKFGSVSCAEHKAIEDTVRLDWLKRDPKDDVESPRHFFLAPNGKILFQRTWTMTAKDLAELMERAASMCTPERLEKWDTREGRLERATDTSRLIRDEAVAALIAENDEELDEQLIKMAKSSKDPGTVGSIMGAFALADTSERRARSHSYLTHAKPAVRLATAYAMERSKAADHAKPLIARSAKEKDEDVRAMIYLALGACGAQDKNAKKALLKQLTHKKPIALAHVAIALAPWAKDEKVIEHLLEIATKDGPTWIRGAAVWTLGTSEQRSLTGKLNALRQTLSRRKWRLRGAIDMAVKSLRGKPSSRYPEAWRSHAPHPVEDEGKEVDDSKKSWK